MTRYRVALIFLSLAVGVDYTAPCAAQEFQKFTIDWDSHPDTVVDLREYLDAPAGGAGFIRAQGEHFVDGNGKRFRMWGINLGGPLCFPSHQEAERTADIFARLGFNCIRFHGMDSSWGRSSLQRENGNSSTLDEENMERFDYFMNQLKQRGIYTNLNLNTFRTYLADDGVPNPDDLGLGKWATHFHPRLIELQEKYARDLLTHKNPYTGTTYANEPAVIVVEIVNENSLIEGWAIGKLQGVDDHSGSTWSPIPVAYADELNRQFNHWLSDNRTAEQLAALRAGMGIAADKPFEILQPHEFRTVPEERFRADYEFIVATERAYLERMKSVIQDEVGLQSMLIGDADHNDSINGYPHIVNNSSFDYIDGHGYWQHPSIGEVTRTQNDPMVNDPLDSTVVQFARTPMVGKPFVISETNHPFPHRYAVEGIPIVTAYALMHDWDGLLFHEWGEGPLAPEDYIPSQSWFRISYNPMKLAELMVAGLIWHRSDIEPANQLIVRSMTDRQLYERMRVEPWKHRPFFEQEFAPALALQHRVRWQRTQTPVQPKYPAAPDLALIESDHGQIRWHGADNHRGRVVIETPRLQSLTGFHRDSRTGNYRGAQQLSANLKNEFGSVTIVSLDDQPIRLSNRMLLFVGDRYTNIDMTWRDDFETVAQWGTGPGAIRPVTGTVSLWGLHHQGRPTVTVLDALGKPTDQHWPVESKDGGWEITVGQPAGLMALIEF